MSWLTQCFGQGWQGDAMVIVFFLSSLLVLRILWRVQRSVENDLDFSDWLRGPDGKASWSKASGVGGFVIGSFCLLYVTWTAKLPEGYTTFFLVYFVVVIGNPAAFEALRRFKPLPGDQQQQNKPTE